MAALVELHFSGRYAGDHVQLQRASVAARDAIGKIAHQLEVHCNWVFTALDAPIVGANPSERAFGSDFGKVNCHGVTRMIEAMNRPAEMAAAVVPIAP